MTTHRSAAETRRRVAAGYLSPLLRRDKCARCKHYQARLIYPYSKCLLFRIEVTQAGICPSFTPLPQEPS